MNDERFRALMREAVGEAPTPGWLRDAVRARVAQPSRRASRAPLFALVAVFLVAAVLSIAIAPRLLNHASSTATTATARSKPVDASNCNLPVIVLDQVPGGPIIDTGGVITSAHVQPGFINTLTGTFKIDASASAAGLPASPFGVQSQGEFLLSGLTPQSSYSAAARRWIPVGPENQSPDGKSYAYLAYLAAAEQPTGRSAYALMRYDVATHRSTRVWSVEAVAYIIKWTSRGILVDANTGLGSPLWLVDPQTGAAAQVQTEPSAPPNIGGVPPFNDGWGINRLGYTSAGELIYSVSTGDRKTDWVFYDTEDGARVFIFKGSPTVFGPWAALADGTGIWFMSGPSALTMWHWDAAGGLRRFTPTGLPADRFVQVYLAGPCV